MLLIFHFAGLLMKNPAPSCEKDRSRDCRQKSKKHRQFNSFIHHGEALLGQFGISYAESSMT
jgi:hypothetical protein